MENIINSNLVFQTGTTLQHGIFILLSLAAAGIALKRDSLTKSAAIGAFFLAVALYFTGGLLFLALLLVFFASSTLLSHYKALIKNPIEAKLHAKGGPRDLLQVGANGGAALIMALLFAFLQDQAFVVGVAIAFAACNADTWASEIGILSKRPPVSLITLKAVTPGISGGVSILGLTASLGGAFAIAITYGFYGYVMGNSGEILLIQIGLITLGGFLGSVIDSLIGSTLQAKYISLETGELTEKPGYDHQPNRLYSGWSFITNDVVNLASSLLAAIMVLIFMRL
ncbi:MAG: DUF92 domain-containing protein [Acetobacterium sp.]